MCTETGVALPGNRELPGCGPGSFLFRRLGGYFLAPPITPFSIALVTASASAWVNVPDATALSSRVFGAVAWSGFLFAERNPAMAALTFVSSMPREDASDLASAAFLAVRSALLAYRYHSLIGARLRRVRGEGL